MRRPRLFLVHGPTPIVRHDALDAIGGANVWVKRDDLTGGAGRLSGLLAQGESLREAIAR